jgi:hypothetical protein
MLDETGKTLTKQQVEWIAAKVSVRVKLATPMNEGAPAPAGCGQSIASTTDSGE